MKKRWLSLVLALMTALSLVVVPAGAAGVPDAFQGIAYYGDECNMTAEQARAFAEVIRSEEAKREQEAKQYAAEHGDAYSDYTFDNQVAFADAGGGVPVMLFFSSLNYAGEGMWFASSVDCGYNSLWHWVDGELVRFLPTTDWEKNQWPAESIFLNIYPDYILACAADLNMSGQVISLGVFPFAGGRVAHTPSTTAYSLMGDPRYMDYPGAMMIDGVATAFQIDGRSVSESEVDAWTEQYGSGGPYDDLDDSLAGYFYLRQGIYDAWGMTPTSQVLAALDAYAASAPGAEPTVAGFSDVKESAWYAGDVADIQQYGLINGHPDGTFRPQEKLTLAQAITLAARTHALLNGGAEIKNGSPWYVPYVNYADANVICQTGEFGSDYNAECSRLAMAVLFQRAFPTDTERVLNNVTTLPDVEDEGYGSSVYFLYRQGVLTGNDASGTFKPDKSVSRAEASAILNRVMNAEKRKSFSLEG